MTIGDYLKQGTAELQKAGIDSARLDVLILLEDALDRDRASILADPDTSLPDDTLSLLNTQIVQRTEHAPLAYIRGKWAFYGRNYTVTRDVLVPRPETEDMVTLLKNLPLPAHPVLADIGTGCGCLAITAALEIKDSHVDASDISPAAITVAKHNNKLHRTNVHFAVRDLLQDVYKPYDAVLANLPYVPDAYSINRAAGHEPKLALFAGPDGLDAYRRLFTELANMPVLPRYVLIEALPEQHTQLDVIAAKSNYKALTSTGYIQLFQAS